MTLFPGKVADALLAVLRFKVHMPKAGDNVFEYPHS